MIWCSIISLHLTKYRYRYESQRAKQTSQEVKQGRLKKIVEFTIKSEITLRDHFTQAICAVRHSLSPYYLVMINQSCLSIA